ncbi:MAG TPA: hypothetical protein VJX23_04110, partial [Candidatus Binataceae bacterium]|nr:hypothetical protein [Candidatus Binataceae bacterium]
FEKSDRRYQRILREVIEEAAARGEIVPARVGLGAAAITELLLSGARGLELAAATAAAFHRRLAELVRVVLAGLGAPSNEGATLA